MPDYVHGYSSREAERLRDQAGGLEDLFHHDTAYPPGSEVLEAGCGVGAQTLILARRSPEARFTCVDISERSLAAARARADAEGLANCRFLRADLMRLPFPDGAFDHVFVCFVLEHLREPRRALQSLRRVLRPGGTLTAIECDHGARGFHPETAEARGIWHALVEVQRRLGGDALLGRQLYPLVREAGYAGVRVSPRVLYADASQPRTQESFVARTVIPMLEGIREQALVWGLMDAASWDRGIRDLRRVGSAEGAFSYTFFKAIASRP